MFNNLGRGTEFIEKAEISGSESDQTITESLAHFVVEKDYNSFPKKVKEHAKVCILDWLGATLAGSLELPAQIAIGVVRELGGSEESTILGTPIRTSCLNAALVNGISGHTIELDDIHEESIIHPAASVIPAALAIAERDNISGKDLIISVILGYEIEIRIGNAMNPTHYQFWHPTGTCGTFGAAAAAGRVLDLDTEEMVHAFGIAGTQAAGLIEGFGTMSKPLQPGKAAMNGVLAALLAKKGFTASKRILEAEKGYCRAASGVRNLDGITENLGKEFELMNNVFKIHASCGHTHGAIDAVLFLAEKHDLKPDEVDSIVVKTYPFAADITGKNYTPKTGAEAKFSLPYCVARALACRKMSIEEFSREKTEDPNVLNLSQRVKVVIDQEYIKARLGCAKVTIYTRRGEKYEHRVDTPKGHPKNPLAKTELEGKFKTLASLVFPEDQIREIVGSVNNLDRVEEVREVTALLS